MIRPRVFLPYTQLDPWVLSMLQAEPIDLTLVEMTTTYSYFELLSQLWAEGETFVIVEHDILVYPGAIQEIWDCEVPFCGKPYVIHGGFAACFGCTKFDASFLRAFPNAMKMGGARQHPMGLGTGYTHWETLDSRIVAALSELGWSCNGSQWPHQHWPSVRHLHYDPLPERLKDPPPAMVDRADWRMPAQ